MGTPMFGWKGDYCRVLLSVNIFPEYSKSVTPNIKISSSVTTPGSATYFRVQIIPKYIVPVKSHF